MRKAPKNFVPQPFAYHEEIELRIDDLSNLGDGVGRRDDWVVFVPFALPGERVRARVWRNKPTYSDADLREVLEPSPDRVAPVCGLFGTCGGCQYQHLAYPAQLSWKTAQIRALLTRLGGIDAPVEPCRGSPVEYGYRIKLTPHHQAMIGKAPDRAKQPIGFQKHGSRAIVDVPACPIASEPINAALPAAREAARQPPKGNRKPRGGTLLLRDCAEGVVTDPKHIVTERVLDRVFQFVAGEFFQNNRHALPGMVSYALEEAAGPRFLVDAYGGVGVFGLCAADRFETVAGVEVSPAAVQLAQANAVINGIKNYRCIAGEAEAIFRDIPFAAEETTVLLDPPRKGCGTAFLDQLRAFGPAKIVYVSCGPDTQAADLKHLVAEDIYQVTRVQPFDLFPQTRHIENVVTLVRTEILP